MGQKPLDIAIFWDLASCPASCGKDLETSGFEIVDRIRTLASRFGVIKAFKGYMAVANTDTTLYSSPWQPLKLRSQLQSSGVSLTDVPGEKDIAEKMAIVDMLAYAFDRSPDDTMLVLITAEPSFSYTLSFLRLRKYRVILIAPENEGTLTLLSQASLSFNWTQERPNGLRDDARPKAPEPAGNPNSPNVRRSSPIIIQSSPASTTSDGSSAEKVSETGRTQDVDLDDYLPQRGRAESSHIPSTLQHPDLSSEDAFHRNPQTFLPESLPQTSASLRRSPTPTSKQYTNFNPRESPIANPSYSEQAPYLAQSAYYHPQAFDPRELSPSPYPTSPSSRANSVNQNVNLQQPDIHGWYGSRPSSSAVPDPEDHIDRLFSTSTPVVEETVPLGQAEQRANEAGFSILIEVLRRFKNNGQIRPLRSNVALQITQKERNAYEKVGTSTFAQYTAKAEILGLITMGGRMGTAWIALNEP